MAGITCRECGCSAEDCSQCITRTGGPCWWVEENLCSACYPDPVVAGQELAKQLAHGALMQLRLPGAIAIVLDRHGHLHVGMSAVDDPCTEPLVELAGSMHGQITKIMEARGKREVPAPRAPMRAACIHCLTDVSLVDDVEAILQHSMTCAKSPAVAEIERLRGVEAAAITVATQWRVQDGINGAVLDDLATKVLGEWTAPEVSRG